MAAHDLLLKATACRVWLRASSSSRRPTGQRVIATIPPNARIRSRRARLDHTPVAAPAIVMSSQADTTAESDDADIMGEEIRDITGAPKQEDFMPCALLLQHPVMLHQVPRLHWLLRQGHLRVLRDGDAVV